MLQGIVIGKFYLEEAAASMDGLIGYTHITKTVVLPKATTILCTLPVVSIIALLRRAITTKIRKTSINTDRRIPIRLLTLLCAFQVVSYIDACF